MLEDKNGLLKLFKFEFSNFFIDWYYFRTFHDLDSSHSIDLNYWRSINSSLLDELNFKNTCQSRL